MANIPPSAMAITRLKISQCVTAVATPREPMSFCAVGTSVVPTIFTVPASNGPYRARCIGIHRRRRRIDFPRKTRLKNKAARRNRHADERRAEDCPPYQNDLQTKSRGEFLRLRKVPVTVAQRGGIADRDRVTADVGGGKICDGQRRVRRANDVCSVK
jgi:hypothetical protein